MGKPSLKRLPHHRRGSPLLLFLLLALRTLILLCSLFILYMAICSPQQKWMLPWNFGLLRKSCCVAILILIVLIGTQNCLIHAHAYAFVLARYANWSHISATWLQFSGGVPELSRASSLSRSWSTMGAVYKHTYTKVWSARGFRASRGIF